MTTHEEYLHLPLSNDFMFGEVMRDEAICREFLEKLLDKKVRRIEYINTQDGILSQYGTHGIRMDVFIEDSEGSVYNVEIQNANRHNIEKRARYYQSMIDTRLLEKGADYRQLNDTYIIFVCTFDYYKMGLAKYTLARYIENTNRRWEDGTHCILLNCRPDTVNVDRSIEEFLAITSGDETGDYSSGLAERIRSRLSIVRADSQKEASYMTFELKLKERIEDETNQAREKGLAQGLAKGRAEGLAEGRAEGLTEGRAEGRAQGLLDGMLSLAKRGLLPIEIAASESGLSIEEFKQKMEASAPEVECKDSAK